MPTAFGMRVRPSLLGLALGVAGCGRTPSRAPLARADGAWLWTEPVALARGTDEGLQRLGVREIYALAGTYSNDGERFVIRLRRTFPARERPRGLRDLHLVYRFDTGGVHRALDAPPESVAASLARTFREDRAQAERAGWRVIGLQLDLDCPTRRLGRYGEVLRALRARVPRPTLLSVTGLATWLGGDVRAALAPVDFWCPQLYEFEAPTDLRHPAPVSAGAGIAGFLPRLEAVGIPYRVGVAAHGQALVYREGRLAGTYRDLSPSEAARLYPRDPSVRGDAGEERAGYRLDAGTTLVFRRPSRTAVLAARGEVARAGGLCAGGILFRVAGKGEELTPSARGLASPIERRGLRVEAEARSDPFSAIEAPRGEAASTSVSRSVALRLSVASPVDPPLRSDGVRVRLSFPAGAAESLLPGDFRGLVPLGPDGRPGVSLARAAGAEATFPWLRAGHPLSLGPIVLRSGKLRARVVVSGYAGDETVEREF